MKTTFVEALGIPECKVFKKTLTTKISEYGIVHTKYRNYALLRVLFG